MFSLEKRHGIEEEFHNNWAKGISVDSIRVREFFEAPHEIENMTILREFGGLNGKRLLDLGCGTGIAAVYFALKGANVFAVDISPEMLKKADELSHKYGVKLSMFKMTAENLRFEDETFDFVFGRGVLHHMDISLSMPEVSRVLKRGGKAIFLEPLGYNPVINMYRKMSKEIRTEAETPFKYNHLTCIKDCFPAVRYKNFWLLSLLVFVYMYIVERIDPAGGGYLDRVLPENSKYSVFLSLLHKLDSVVLRVFPFLGRFCLNIMIILKK